MLLFFDFLFVLIHFITLNSIGPHFSLQFINVFADGV